MKNIKFYYFRCLKNFILFIAFLLSYDNLYADINSVASNRISHSSVNFVRGFAENMIPYIVFFIAIIIIYYINKFYKTLPAAFRNAIEKILLTIFSAFMSFIAFATFDGSVLAAIITFISIIWLVSHDTNNSIAQGKTPHPFLSMFIIGFLCFIVAVSKPPHHGGSRWQARQKMCYSNIRVIQGAAEMYNMDVPEAKMMSDLDLATLVKNHYLKAEPRCPESNLASYTNYGKLDTNGDVMCGNEPIGGTIQNFERFHGILAYPPYASQSKKIYK